MEKRTNLEELMEATMAIGTMVPIGGGEAKQEDWSTIGRVKQGESDEEKT